MRNHIKKNRKWMAASMTLIALGTSVGVLYAQPDMDDVPKADNPPNWQNGGREGREGREGRGGRGGGQGGPNGQNNNRPDFRNMTPEQREQFQQQRQQEMQQRREQNLRQTLTDAGFTSTVVQDAVVEFANAQDAERDATEEKVRALRNAIRDGASDNDIAVLLSQARADAANARARRTAALRALDAKIGYTKSAKLDGILALSGITGEELSPGGRGGMGGPGMMGGPGGRGMRGGQGGQGMMGGGRGGRGGDQGGKQGGGFGGGPTGPGNRAQNNNGPDDGPNA